MTLLQLKRIIKIETYWNVNINYAISKTYINAIKIETYWNVNLPK